MPPLFRPIFLALLFASPLAAEDLTIRGLERGKSYVIEVSADGSVTVNVTRIVTVGTSPAPGPTDPNPPAGSPFQQEITRQTKTVLINQGGSKTTGAALSTVYSLVAGKVADGSIKPESAFAAINAASSVVLVNSDDGPAWDSWRKTLSEALTKLQQEGSLTTKDQIAKTFKEIAAGMDAATGYKPAMLHDAAQAPGKGILGGIDIDKLIKIIELVMTLLKLFGVGG